MKRRFLIAAVTVLSLALPVAARADFVDDMVVVLTQQGYSDIEVLRTLLGRTRILASNDNGTRELVVNPRTGEVLRDVWTTQQGEQLPQMLSGTSQDDEDDDHSGGGGGGDDHSGTGGGGNEHDERDDDDSSDEENSDEDNSGEDNSDEDNSDEDNSGKGSDDDDED